MGAEPGDLAMLEWLRRHAVPLESLDPTGTLDDLQAVRPMFEGARVVGLGEDNHGTREFFRVKHRLLRFLVEEMGFTRFAMEAPYATGRAVDDYVRFGCGQAGDVWTSLRYTTWDNTEIVDMIQWMRDYNAGVPEQRMIRFWGVDVTYTSGGAEFLRDFLARVAPQRLAAVEPVLDKLMESDDRFPNARTETDSDALAAGAPVLDDLIAFVRSDRDPLEEETSRDEVDSVEMLLTVMGQWSRNGDVSRSRHMGENLVQLLDRSAVDTKVVFWAHNSHIDRDWDEGEPSAGGVLSERYGPAYTPWRLDCAHGSLSARARDEGTFGSYGVEPVRPKPADSLAGCLDRTGLGNLAVDLRPGADLDAVAAWTATPAWIPDEPSSPDEGPSASDVAQDLPTARYDGMVFVQEISPAHPTANGLANAAAGRGL